MHTEKITKKMAAVYYKAILFVIRTFSFVLRLVCNYEGTLTKTLFVRAPFVITNKSSAIARSYSAAIFYAIHKQLLLKVLTVCSRASVLR